MLDGVAKLSEASQIAKIDEAGKVRDFFGYLRDLTFDETQRTKLKLDET
jgi:hypothetical protein